MAATRKVTVEERLTVVEKTLEKILAQLKLMEVLDGRIQECEKRGKESIENAKSQDSDQKIVMTSEEILSRIGVGEIRNEDRVVKLETQVMEIGDTVEALRVRFQEFKSEFPIPTEIKSSEKSPVQELPAAGSSRNAESGSCGEKLKVTENSVLIVGDSLTRGVGDKLKDQCGKVFERESRGGARIESITEDIKKLEDDSKRHLVVMVGTNNLESDFTEDILVKYDRLLEELKKKKNKKVTVVGILKRYDLKGMDMKRIWINFNLRKKFDEKGIAFLGFDPDWGQMREDNYASLK